PPFGIGHPAVARQVGIGRALGSALFVDRPVGRLLAAGAAAQHSGSQQCGGQAGGDGNHGAHGSRTSASFLANGHLRFSSVSMPSTLRRLASTSARKSPSWLVASLALAPTAWTSTSTASTFFRLPRTSPSTALSCCTVARTSGI